MEPYHLWREEHCREVEKVLEEMRAGKDDAAHGPVVMNLADGIIFPSQVQKALQAALADAAALRVRVEELASGFEAKSRELEAELCRRGRLKDLVIQLHLQESTLEREAQEARHGAQESMDKCDGLQIQLDAKVRAFDLLLARHDAAEKDYLERLQRFTVQVGELEIALDDARRRTAGVDALEAGHRRQLQEAAAATEEHVEKLERLHQSSVKQWETDRLELQRRLDESCLVKESLETHLEGAARQNDELRQQAAQAHREALNVEDEVAQRTIEKVRALQAERLCLQEEAGQAQRESAARRAEADKLLAEARRREAAAEKAILDARQVRSSAVDVAKTLRLEKERLRQLTASQAALTGERDLLAAELGAQRQDAIQDQDRIASLRTQLDEAERRRDESEQARSQLEESVQCLSAAAERLQSELAERSAAVEALDELRAELAAKDAEARQARAFLEAAVRESAEAKAESQRRLDNAEALQREANETMDAAVEFRSQAHLRLEVEREKLQVEVTVRAAAEQARLSALTQALQSLEGMRAEQSAERSRILREVHEELSLAETAIAVAPLVSPQAPPPLASALLSRGPAPILVRAPESQPRRRDRIRNWSGVAAVVLLSGCWLWKSLATAGRDYPIPFVWPGAMAWQGDVLWVADPQAQALHRFRLESGHLRDDRSFSLPGLRIVGLAAAGAALYVADAGANEIQKRRVDDALTLEKSWPMAAQNISALACDGTSLFAAFSKPGRIRQYALDENLSVVNTFFGPPTPVGMAVVGGVLWAADGQSRLLLRYSVDSALSVRDVHAVPGLGPGALSGFTLRGRSAWLVQNDRALVLERPRWLLEDRVLADVPVDAPDASSPSVPVVPLSGS